MPILFDSSVYIEALRGDFNAPLLMQRWSRESPLWLSSVVLEELYAGAQTTDHRILEKLERDFAKANRILVPSLNDWTHTGKLLALMGSKYGYENIGRARLTNDALIATSAARLGVTVITVNARDFSRLAQHCPLQWQKRSLQEPVS